jgi:glucose-6-phosphate isomerase
VTELEASSVDPTLDRLKREDVVGQILGRRGRMARLATEAGDVKLDWCDQVSWALAHREVVAEVEELAESIRSRFSHLVWSGMGGSIQAVHTLKGLGLLDRFGLEIHPLDSTDPAALNRLLRELGAERDLRSALGATLMIGVSMGMTSEEPITHLRWFTDLLRGSGVEHPSEHVMVMTLPGSYLDSFASEQGARRVHIQLDGASHTPGRMSAPSTRVFMLPAALALPGRLLHVLGRCDAESRLRPAMVGTDPFVRLAAWLSIQLEAGRDMCVLDLPARWAPLAPWLEQVVEESLGKGGRGLLLFYDQDLGTATAWPSRFSILSIDEGSGRELPAAPRAVLPLGSPSDPESLLALCARFFAGSNLAVALLGYLQDITFAGQPAVEGYKSYARRLRDEPGELPYPADKVDAAALAQKIETQERAGRLGYFDLTINGEPAGPLWKAALRAGRRFGNEVLRRPTKVRSGPRDYHSTEQSETDGPADLLSLRVLVEDPEPVNAGEYSPRFLHAQALGTLLAMRDAGRPVMLATVRRAEADTALTELLETTAAILRG